MTKTFTQEKETTQDIVMLPKQIGIFLGQQKWNALISQHFNPGLKELVRAVDHLNLMPVWFSIPQAGVDEGKILAATKQHGFWQIMTENLPKVVYDLGVFDAQGSPEARRIKTVLAEHQVKFVNSRSAFSKWTTHALLVQDNLISTHLPHTIRLASLSNLADMLSCYTQVCVKSYWGSRGKEVLFIEKSNKVLKLLLPDGTKQTYEHISDLGKAISRFMGPKKCIIQQRIKLATRNNCNFDIRVLLQKISLHQWDCTALCLRLALPGHGSTSTSQGSKVMVVKPVLLELWPLRYLEIIERIKQLAFDTAVSLENQYGPLGELGIDVGVDINGEVWLIEVNGKPGKGTVRKLKQDHITQRAYQRPLLYATMLLEEK